jgi:hypothetical protein
MGEKLLFTRDFHLLFERINEGNKNKMRTNLSARNEEKGKFHFHFYFMLRE